MSKISQPVRIALLAVIVLAAAWFMLLRPHSPATTPTPTPAPAPTTTAPQPAAPASTAGLPPGVAGLSRAVQHARAAVTASQGAAQGVTNLNPSTPTAASAAAAAAAAAAKASPPSSGAAAAPPATTTPAAQGTTAATTAPPAPAPQGAAATAAASGPVALSAAIAAGRAALAAAGATAHAAVPLPAAAPAPAAKAAVKPHLSEVAKVQQELGEGKVVVILFWNPNASDDQSVRQQLRAIDHQDGIVVTHVATAAQVTDYGTVTSTIDVLETPTIVIINPKGQASTLVGLVDAKTIDQAVGDAELAAGTDQLPALTSFAPRTARAAYVRRVNAMCTRVIHHAGTIHITSASTLKQTVAQLSAVNNQILNNVLHLSPPAQDGAYIDAAIGHERNAYRLVRRAVAEEAAQGGATPHTRALLLEVQSEDDRAAIMFSTYGLSACVVH